ncbi:nuclear transport factor 2 family protein [Amycolatopsis circi]|uniref:nuclear transport factor 2 family protein n=1 Tax=Amycolatopsis circi TaxID=871959 RepID=UPI000E27A4F7|nr:nuclear transport factor 2 family protein [Amycolatopsis circi]
MTEEIRAADRQAIIDLMTGWIHRDRQNWDALANLFHDDATLTILWFSGQARDFVDGSRRMSGGPLRSKHFIGTPVIEIAGDRAFVETNAMLVADHLELGLGVTVHNGFLDRVERRDGVWRIVRRDSVYDMGGFTYPLGVRSTDDLDPRRHPREYAALAYLLEHSGHQVPDTCPTRFSKREQEILEEGQAWLTGVPA